MSEEKNVISEFLRNVQEGNENAIELAQTVLGDGTKTVKLNLARRTLQKELPLSPSRAESPRRAHVFHDIVGFKDYLNKYKTENSVIFADVPAGQIAAVLNETAEKGFEIIILRPQVHPLFKPWVELTGSPAIPICDFATFVTANRRAVIGTDVKQLILTLSQIRASKKITIQQGTGKRGINGVNCEFEIQGVVKNDTVELPDVITIDVPLYVATEEVKLEFDLTVGFGENNEVVVGITSADVKVKAIQAFEKMIEELTTDGVIVTLGCPAHADWKYLT